MQDYCTAQTYTQISTAQTNTYSMPVNVKAEMQLCCLPMAKHVGKSLK